jgi:hypothetical protein
LVSEDLALGKRGGHGGPPLQDYQFHRDKQLVVWVNLARSFENMNNRLLNFFSRAVIENKPARSASMHL